MTGALHLCPRRPDPRREVVADRVERAAVPAGDDELREGCRRQRGQRQIGLPRWPTPAEQRYQRLRSGEDLGGKRVRIAAHRFQKALEPLIIGEIL